MENNSKYNFLEKSLSNFLTLIPWLKPLAKRLYEYINFFIYKPKEKLRCQLPIQKVLNSNENSFFGYYDKSPDNGKFILTHSTSESTHQHPKKISQVFLNVINQKEGSLYKKIKIRSFNWQQGSRAHWFSQNTLIYNDFDGKSYVSVLMNLDVENSTLVLPKPMYDTNPNGLILGTSFERLAATNVDYGYFCQDNPKWKEDLSCIYRICPEKLEVTNIVTYEEILALLDLKPTGDFTVNHILISPKGNSFVFIFRYFGPLGRRDYLFYKNLTTGKLKCLLNTHMVSHYVWISDHELFGYWRGKRSQNDSFYTLDIDSEQETCCDWLGDFGKSDGHPTFFDGKIVFDSYPDKSRMKDLYFIDLKTFSINRLGSFYEGLEYDSVWRCDLHPRFSFDGKSIFIDSVHEGERSLYVIELDSIN